MILCLVYIYMMAVVDNICIYVTVDNNNIYIYVAVARGVTATTDLVLKPLTPSKLLNLHSIFIHFLCSKRGSPARFLLPNCLHCCSSHQDLL